MYGAPLENHQPIQRRPSFFVLMAQDYVIVSRDIRVTFALNNDGEKQKKSTSTL